MKRCVFKLNSDRTGQYIEDYDETKTYSPTYVIVNFTSEKTFKEIIQIDDADFKCMVTQVKNKVHPLVLTR